VIEAFASCGVLMALVWFFERGENKPDTNDIITVVIFPLICSALAGVTALFLSTGLVAVIRLVVFLGATFYVLFKLLKLPMKRSLGYTTAVLATNVAASVVVYALLHRAAGAQQGVPADRLASLRSARGR
jgi:hypothetical protein